MLMSEAEALIIYCKVKRLVDQEKNKRGYIRVITECDEMIFRLVHHVRKFRATDRQFTQAECGRILNIPTSTVSRRLEHIERVMSQYFPILTIREVAIYNRRVIQGMSYIEIVDCLCIRKGFEDLTERIVKKTLDRVKTKGYEVKKGSLGRVLSYDAGWDSDGPGAREGMDAYVKRSW